MKSVETFTSMTFTKSQFRRHNRMLKYMFGNRKKKQITPNWYLRTMFKNK